MYFYSSYHDSTPSRDTSTVYHRASTNDRYAIISSKDEEAWDRQKGQTFFHD
jgi:hypothetical protein